MTYGTSRGTWALAALVTMTTLAAIPTAQGPQTPSRDSRRPSSNWTAPRTADGQPDLQGVWNYATLTPLERPDEFADKAVFTQAEAAAFEQAVIRRNNVDEGEPRGGTGTYNEFWWDRGTSVVGTRRTSLIVDPPNGKLPPMTAATKQKAAAFAEAMRGPAAGPEDRNLSERCMVGFTNGTPFESRAYNQNLQIFQNRDYVVLFNEMVHDARIVPLDGRPHLSSGIRHWSGDARGHWEGDTLVVDTTNFVDRTDSTIIGNVRGASDAMHLVERFTRVGPTTLLYQYTVNDAKTYTQPYTVEHPMTASDEAIYEYACHEGNIGMFGILSGARADEKAGRKGGTR